jgi:hypothetical protein
MTKYVFVLGEGNISMLFMFQMSFLPKTLVMVPSYGSYFFFSMIKIFLWIIVVPDLIIRGCMGMKSKYMLTHYD